ncbi:hypothetical protein CMQ_3131 [Grosmannia clavigera kw1407]|uniref:Bactericidal permeability-increasing protein n=1 Tax=Grosmannia clavigera (strain kw1407 / UAMH 11150) TaxID=655863 RepID=F0XHJ6_GROCL|nr:uncharacterized protein CMQ_3131 [Grosmannia clavigera kw1407]EFX03202.1 hypothetical protein CMQ_3131 [Grosmannia clavigera kw1407]
MSSRQVNRPTNIKQRDEDIGRKLQLYGIANAFGLGKLPSNDQIDTTLNSLLSSKALSSPSGKLSPEGRALVAEFRDVVSQAKYLVLSKNQGNLLQDFIWQTSNHDYKSIQAPGSSVDKAVAKTDGDQALQGLKTVGNLVITNGQFRKLLKDASIIIRDMAADGATKFTSKVRPGEDDLAQIDAPAADNTWHEAPNFSKENMRSRAQAVYKKKNNSVDVPVGDTTDAPAADGVDQVVENKTSNYRSRGRDYLSTKIPQERRDQVVWRLKKMVIECQQHPDYQQAVQTLLDLAEKYQGHAQTTASSSASTVQGARSALAKAEADLKTLIERFANGTSTNGLWDSIGAIYDAAKIDPELKGWFRALDQYIRRCLQEKGYILEESSTSDWDKIYDHGKYLLRGKYNSQTNRVLDEVKFVGEQFDKDPQNKAFGESVRRLLIDLGNDENGKPKFKPHLVKDLTNVIIPTALENISYIPIPRIEYSDPQIDAVIENLVFESDNFMPNMVHIFNSNNMSWGRKMTKVGKNKHTVQVKVAGIQTDLRNVSYYVKRKQGFPSLTDIGIFSVLMAGHGFSFQLGLSTADAVDAQHFFKVDSVHVDIDYLKIKLHKSRHKMLFNLFKPLLMRILRPTLQKVLEKAIRDNFHKFDAALYDIKKDADRVGKAAEGDPDSPTPNSYSRFYQAAQKRFTDNKQQKKKAAAGKKSDQKMNYAFTKEDSIFPNIQLPGGFSSKATEFRDMARQGEAWHSPVFALGSASRSKDIPAAPKVERKAIATSAGSTGNNAAYGINDTDFAEISPNATASTAAGTVSDAADTASTAASKMGGTAPSATRQFYQ